MNILTKALMTVGALIWKALQVTVFTATMLAIAATCISVVWFCLVVLTSAPY